MSDHRAARRVFAQRLREVRRSRRLTQEQLAELIGKTTEHISFLERAERSPSFEVLFDLAQVLEISVADLINERSSGTRILTKPGILPVDEPVPEPASTTPQIKQQQKSDLERLNDALKGIREAQRLANEYGINDSSPSYKRHHQQIPNKSATTIAPSL
jgi:transcriptional regulator with XRE-family HTH domain